MIMLHKYFFSNANAEVDICSL